MIGWKVQLEFLDQLPATCLNGGQDCSQFRMFCCYEGNDTVNDVPIKHKP